MSRSPKSSTRVRMTEPQYPLDAAKERDTKAKA